MGSASHRNGLRLKRDTPILLRFLNFRLVFEGEFQSSNTGRCIPEWLDFNDRGRKNNPIHVR